MLQNIILSLQDSLRVCLMLEEEALRFVGKGLALLLQHDGFLNKKRAAALVEPTAGSG